MASIIKEQDGWHAFVCIGGKRRSKRFPGKGQAADWANRIERQLRDGEGAGGGGRHTLADAMERYDREVTPNKKGARWESIRLKLLQRDKRLVDVKLSKLSSTDLAAWRDRRLGEVSGATVAREMNLISHVLTIARKEWRWMPACTRR